MESSGISFRLTGADRGNDLVRAGDFVAFVQRLLGTLSEIDVTLNGHVTRIYRFTALEIGSAAGTLHESVDDAYLKRRHILKDVEPAFQELVASVSSNTKPDWSTPQVLIKLRELVTPLNHVSAATLHSGNQKVALDDEFRKKVDTAIGRDVTSFGEIVGTLDAVNVHDHFRAFLYPRRGETRISCDFSVKQKPEIVAALGSRVRIKGELKRRLDSDRPYHVRIIAIERLPKDSDLPLFESIFGMSEAFPDIDPVDYIRRLREADA
jgi:hypothetical protein